MARITHDRKRSQIVFEDYDGNTFRLPARFEVCETCHGTGSHVNRAIDGHGLSHDELYDDPDFAEAYFSGAYDVVCGDCRGERVELVVDEERAQRSVPEGLAAYFDYLQDEAAYRAELASERRAFGY